ncbi:FAD-dependent oxidoreductase [Thermoleophilia bacterium SCSIO 60948]|nr:FAD-dependent oxidoreductase [Thermoleophilia bacterium SCSIO 60948]
MADQLKVAVVGAGPAGAFAVAQLNARGRRFDIDVFERLPTPWGLLRAGVAPDHGTIKKLDETFDKEVFGRGCRFFGNVRVGEDVTHADLAERYHAVIYAVGAQTDKSLGIPGEDLPGSMPATAFVGWYNGHPDFRDLAPDLSHPTAVVIGNGNVAADVTRVLTRSVDELARTDIADHALEALRESRVERVIMLGRRGPAQAAFTNAELRELGRMDGVNVVVRPEDVELDPVSADWLETEGTFTARRNVEALREFAASPPHPDGFRSIELRFLRSPVAIHGEGRVEQVEVVENELFRDEGGMLRARAVDGSNEKIEAGLVLRSVGYRGVALPDVPFDERRYVLPNEAGRVLDAGSGERLPGVYAVGWIKRGPTGILGTNKRDAAETVDSLVADWESGSLPEPSQGDVAELLGGKDDLVTAVGWRAIESQELAAGQRSKRPRVKIAEHGELLSAARSK